MGYVSVEGLVDAATSTVSAIGTPSIDFSQFTTLALQSLIDRAANQIDGYCKQTFQLTNLQERYTGRGTNRLFLRKFPLAQLPDSIFGGSGPVTQSLVVDTTFTTAITSGQISGGINTVHVADISNLLPGQYLQWGDGTAEPGLEIVSVVPTTAGALSGPGTVTLKGNLTLAHPIPPANTSYPTARVVVNTIDFLMIVLPTQAAFPIPIQQLVVDAQKGELLNYTPLMFQNLGYATIFPAMLPLLVRYTYGFPLGQVPDVLAEVNIEQARRIALQNMHLGAAGVQSVKSGDASVSYTVWKPTPFGEDLQDYLGPFRRNVGFH